MKLFVLTQMLKKKVALFTYQVSLLVICKYENGQKKSEGNFKDGKKDGKRTSWNENGQIEVEENFKDDLIDETAYLYHENGQKHYEINFKDSKVEIDYVV